MKQLCLCFGRILVPEYCLQEMFLLEGIAETILEQIQIYQIN